MLAMQHLTLCRHHKQCGDQIRDRQSLTYTNIDWLIDALEEPLPHSASKTLTSLNHSHPHCTALCEDQVSDE